MTATVRGHTGRIINAYVAKDGTLYIEIDRWGPEQLNYFGWISRRGVEM